MHPDLEPLAFLAGRWRGTGEGRYPTIDPFRYGEEISFTAPPGKPFLAYAQRTWALPGEEPLHTEAGYLRPGGQAGPELVVAQPTGVVEVHRGEVDGSRLHLRTAHVGLTASAKRVDSVERILWLDGESLRYELHMGAVGQAHQIHLEAELRPV